MGADANALAGKVNRCWHTSTRRSNFAQTKHPDILSSSPSELFCCFRAGSHSREQDWFMISCLLGQGNFTMDLFELPYCLSISDPRKERQNSCRGEQNYEDLPAFESKKQKEPVRQFAHFARCVQGQDLSPWLLFRCDHPQIWVPVCVCIAGRPPGQICSILLPLVNGPVAASTVLDGNKFWSSWNNTCTLSRKDAGGDDICHRRGNPANAVLTPDLDSQAKYGTGCVPLQKHRSEKLQTCILNMVICAVYGILL